MLLVYYFFSPLVLLEVSNFADSVVIFIVFLVILDLIGLYLFIIAHSIRIPLGTIKFSCQLVI